MKRLNKSTAWAVGSIIFTGCLFLGKAVGAYFQVEKPALYVGIGIGLILMALVLYTNLKSVNNGN